MKEIKEFFSANSKAIVKLYINQIAMAVFGFMVIGAAHQSDLLVLLASFLSVGLYLFIIYSMMWEQGAKAAAKTLRAEDAGIKKIQTPFLIVLFGSLINILGYIAYNIFQIYVNAGNLTEGAAVDAGSLLGVFMKLINSIYAGFESFLFPNPNYADAATETALILYLPAYYFFLTLIPLFATGIFAYYMGASEISILRKLGFKLKDKKVSDTHIDWDKNKK